MKPVIILVGYMHVDQYTSPQRTYEQIHELNKLYNKIEDETYEIKMMWLPTKEKTEVCCVFPVFQNPEDYKLKVDKFIKDVTKNINSINDKETKRWYQYLMRFIKVPRIFKK